MKSKAHAILNGADNLIAFCWKNMITFFVLICR